MYKVISILAFVLFFSSGCKDDPVITDPTPTVEQPNILLIIADDLGIEASPSYNIGTIKPNMPHLENLMSDGITFDNVWAFPVCSPTRSSILTGRYGVRTGVLNAEDASMIQADEKTIQAFLDEKTNSAYSHAIIGKWHLSNNEPSRPTDMGVGYYAGLLGGGVSDYNQWPFTENSVSNQYTGYITSKITDLAIDWINAQSKPWFCWTAYTAPHTPFHFPEESMHSQGVLPTDQASIDANPLPYFMAMIESLDFELGRLLDNIPSEELENTIIIFIGDNGTHAGVIQAPYEMNQSKGSLFQGGIHVPMVIAGKGVSRINTRDNNMISSTDLFSTIAEIAGIDLPIYEDSYSFFSLLNSTSTGTRIYNYSEVLNTDMPNKSGYTVRNDRYKFIQLDSDQQRLYDLTIDPYESNNLLQGTLTTEQNDALQELIDKANEIRQ